MPTLYVTEPGAVVRKDAHSLIVTIDDVPHSGSRRQGSRRRLMEIEPHRLELIALVGRVHVTSDATLSCLDHGIAIAWFSWNGHYRGRIVPELPRSADLRLLQYRDATETDRRRQRSRAVVAAKLVNAAAVLTDIQSNDPGNEPLSRAIAGLKRQASKTDEAADDSTLLGLEGMGTRTYFEALRNAFKGEILFDGRARRPPPDPVNALLSFGYVLLTNLLAGYVEARGLDPALGFFHDIRPGRPSLALDLLEEWRHPIVDRFVLRGCNLQIFRTEMFEPDPDADGGIRLTRDGLRVFFREWEKALNRGLRERHKTESITPLDLCRRQINRLAADLRGNAPYQPFRYGG